MKIAIDEALTFEFDDWNLKLASEHLDKIVQHHKGDAQKLLNALLTLLLFGQLEKQRPGTLRQFLAAGEKVATSLTWPPKEQEAS